MLYLVVLIVGCVVGVLYADYIQPKLIGVYDAVKTALKGQ